MVYLALIPVRLLIWNTMSAFYRLARGITAEGFSLCVVLENPLSCLCETYLPPLTQFFRWNVWVTSLRLKYIGLWHILYWCFFFRYIPWWYQNNFYTANHSTCHGAGVIDVVHWIAVTFCVGEVRVSSLRHNCANFPWYFLPQSTQALQDAKIMCNSLIRQQTGNMWVRLYLFVYGMYDDTVGDANTCVHVWIHLHRAVNHWSLALRKFCPLPILKSRYVLPCSWMSPGDALKSALVSCCASRCDEYAVDWEINYINPM